LFGEHDTCSTLYSDLISNIPKKCRQWNKEVDKRPARSGGVQLGNILDREAERARGIAQHFEQLADSGLTLDVSLDEQDMSKRFQHDPHDFQLRRPIAKIPRKEKPLREYCEGRPICGARFAENFATKGRADDE
jgi:hypothetical protein